MPDYVETSTEGWFSRMGKAILGIPVGLMLIPISMVVLFWNEGRAVQTAKSLAEGRAAVVDATPESVNPANDGKLVHVTGMATTDEVLKDPQFLVSAKALKLRRIVKMYQWKENVETKSEKQVGGGRKETKTYTYTREWSEKRIDSSSFKQPEEHQNPSSLPFDPWSATAKEVKVGAYRLPESLVSQINNAEPLPVDEAVRTALPPDLRDRVKVDAGHFYLGKNPSEPAIGDTIVEFQQYPPTTVSLLAQQTGSTFQPYQTQAGDAINRLQVGAATAPEMFAAAEKENTILTWVLRLVGFLLMAGGVGLILKPFTIFADVIPFVGNIVEAGTGLVAVLVAAPLTLATIAVGWIFYRPVLGIALLAVAAAVVVGLVYLVRSRRRARPGTAGAA